MVVFGAGYVGTAVSARAIAAGARVSALSRNPETCAHLESVGCRSIQAPLESDTWHDQIGDVDFIVNCVSSGRQGLEGYRKSYLAGSRSILRWGERFGEDCPALIYTGSTSVYPQGGGQEVDETLPTAATDERAELLLETEKTLLSWPGGTTILRLAGIYGPGRHHLLDQLRSRPAELPGTGGQTLNLVHLDDIVSAIWSAWECERSDRCDIFNVVDDGRATKSEVVSWLAGKLGVPLPDFTGQTAPGRRAQRPDRVILNHKLKSTLGWSPTFPSFREGYESILLDA